MAENVSGALVTLAEEGVTSLGRNADAGFVVRVRERGYQDGQWVGSYANEQDAQTVADRIARATAGTVHWITEVQVVVTKNGRLALAAQRQREAGEEVQRLAVEAVARGDEKSTVAAIAGITRPTLDRWIAKS